MNAERIRQSAVVVVPALLAASALAVLYAPLAPCLTRLPVVGTDNMGLGLLGIVLVGVLAWQKREALRSLPSAPDARGWGFVVLGAVLAIIGYRLSRQFVLTISLPVMLAGILWCLKGRRWVAELWFPLLLLAALTRIPADLEKAVNYPLQAMVARLSAVLLELGGVRFEQAGLVFVLGKQTITVSEGCSGWRSLTAAFWLFLVFVYWQRPSRWWQWLGFLLLLLPAALVANVLRVVTVVALFGLGHLWAVEPPWHELLGLVFFVPVAYFFVQAAGASCAALPATSPGPAEEAEAPPANSGSAFYQMWWLAACLCFASVCAHAAGRQAQAVPLLVQPPELPTKIADWQRTDYVKAGPASKGEWKAYATYQNGRGQPAQVVWQLPFATGAVPLRMVNVHLKHGYVLVDKQSKILASPSRSIQTQLSLLARGGDQLTVVSTHLHPQFTLASVETARIWRMAEQLIGMNQPWITLAVSTPDPQDAIALEQAMLPLAEGWLVEANNTHHAQAMGQPSTIPPKRPM